MKNWGNERSGILASRTKVLAGSAIFAAMIAVGGLISIPLVPIPFSFQTFFVYLGVLKLRKYAFMGVVIYIAMGLVGMPVFANGLAGYSVLIGPAGGFLIGFLGGSIIAGRLPQAKVTGRYAGLVPLAVCALFVFTSGWLWLAYWMGGSLAGAFLAGVLPFLPGDATKILLALAINKKLRF
jgi:biotin transport system substrate-specific component